MPKVKYGMPIPRRSTHNASDTEAASGYYGIRAVSELHCRFLIAGIFKNEYIFFFIFAFLSMINIFYTLK